MAYKEDIKEISQKIPSSIVNLTLGRRRGSPPTQAFSDFLTHSEQGDWAETLFFKGLKKLKIPYIPIRYGRSDKIIAGDPDFKDFYERYQNELDSIGKRPDILLFKPDEYKKEWGEDISQFSLDELFNIVPHAIVGFEVRSSAYLTKKYKPKDKRPFLSFTPKVEDLLVVLKWIDIFGVPQFYIQVFFDSIYAISFKKILWLLKNADIEERGKKNKKLLGKVNNSLAFIVEKNPKNQYKETIHIFLNQGRLLSDEIMPPKLVANKKELAGGRLLHYVSFHDGEAKIKEKVLLNLIDKPF